MATPRVGRAPKNSPAAANASDSVLAKMSAGGLSLSGISGLVGYAINGKPLYDLIRPLGAPTRITNDLDNCFGDTFEAKRLLKHGEAGFSYSEKFQNVTLAVKDGEGIYYFGVPHDKDGEVIVEDNYILVHARVNRDFQIKTDNIGADGKPVMLTILKAGQEVFRAVSEEYFAKMEQAS